MACLLALALLSACSSTQQVTTAPPRSGIRGTDEPVPDDNRARVSVVLQTGASPLPDDVDALRFRAAEVWFKPADSTWIRLPAEPNQFETNDSSRPERTVLSTLLPPVPYDSVGITLGDVFVLFSPNAGAPLTLPRDEPVRLALPFLPVAGSEHTIRFKLEPAPSLTRDNSCRWYFLPFLTAHESTE